MEKQEINQEVKQKIAQEEFEKKMKEFNNKVESFVASDWYIDKETKTDVVLIKNTDEVSAHLLLIFIVNPILCFFGFFVYSTFSLIFLLLPNIIYHYSWRKKEDIN